MDFILEDDNYRELERAVFRYIDITVKSLRKIVGNDVYSIMDHSLHSDWSVASHNTCVHRSSVVQNLRHPTGQSENGL